MPRKNSISLADDTVDPTADDHGPKARSVSEIPGSMNPFRALAEQAADGIIIAQSTGKVLFVNRRLSEMSGYSIPELMDPANLYKFQTPEEVARIMEHSSQRAQGKTVPTQYHSVMLHKDGCEIPIELTACLISWDGEPASAAIVRDISDRKEMERQMRQTEKMEAIGHLAGGIAHDFNNQLGGIMGYVDLLSDRLGDDPNLLRFTDNISMIARRAADLTDQLLAFARKGKYQTVAVDLHRIIGEVASLLQRSIDKRIQISQLLNAPIFTVEGDPTQLQNALLNLGINARDAMPEGGILLYATEMVELDRETCAVCPFGIVPGKYLKLAVTDTGCGIDEETQRHMFEPFYTTKASGEGTGLGLAAVYGTVKTHKGKIDVISTVGQGTTIELYFPIPEMELHVTVEKRSKRPSIPGTANVLVVDDERVIRGVATEMLEGLGYKVRAFELGDEALEYYRENWRAIDLVLLDMVMPSMSGNEVFRAMREINPDVRTVLSSGYSADDEIGALLRSGARGFIQKPYRMAALSRVIAGALAS